MIDLKEKWLIVFERDILYLVLFFVFKYSIYIDLRALILRASSSKIDKIFAWSWFKAQTFSINRYLNTMSQYTCCRRIRRSIHRSWENFWFCDKIRQTIISKSNTNENLNLHTHNLKNIVDKFRIIRTQQNEDEKFSVCYNAEDFTEHAAAILYKALISRQKCAARFEREFSWLTLKNTYSACNLSKNSTSFVIFRRRFWSNLSKSFLWWSNNFQTRQQLFKRSNSKNCRSSSKSTICSN